MTSVPTAPAPPSRHPAGNCAGRRNASAFGTGLPNGASPRSFTLEQWKPEYKLVAANPDRGPGAKNHFAALYRALRRARVLSDDGQSFLNLLLDESNAKAKSVTRQVWWLAAELGWNETKVKQARLECERLGLLVHHNRRHETTEGVRMRANRYGFTWNRERLAEARFHEDVMIKHCGVPDIVYLEKVRRELRSKRREEAILSGRAQAERGIALRVVEDLIAESRDFREADDKVRARFAGDAELENFAVDHLERQWPRHEAVLEGVKISHLDVSQYSKEQHLQKRYADRPELLEIAMGAISIPRRE